MKLPPFTGDKDLERGIARAETLLRKKGINLTLGGEPTLVPLKPEGDEWQITAVGPHKLSYAYQLADRLQAQLLPHGVLILSPGKAYPGETNPRWSLHLVWRRDEQPMLGRVFLSEPSKRAASSTRLARLREVLAEKLQLEVRCWRSMVDSERPGASVWVLPMDEEDGQWLSPEWTLPRRAALTHAEGPAGLRLPLHLLKPSQVRRALTLEIRHGVLHFFLPPLAQPAFKRLLNVIGNAIAEVEIAPFRLEGYLPSDQGDEWVKLGLTADPGVLEINLPPCENWRDYAGWLTLLETYGAETELRTFHEDEHGRPIGTGGGNHLLFGSAKLEKNSFFTRPQLVAGLCRFFQKHPSLAYFFTGKFVGPSSQAPRPDESLLPFFDVELSYRALEELPAGKDHRGLIGETLRHVHIDGSGSSHRSEISFDKFWNPNAPGGCQGLIEFRAIESMPEANWSSAVAGLWLAIAAHVSLTAREKAARLVPHGPALHDAYLLPTGLWKDFLLVLDDLNKAGICLPEDVFFKIWQWRFPLVLEDEACGLTIRKGLEPWPLLSETPVLGGTTSRFVDSSLVRWEFLMAKAKAKEWRMFANGRLLELKPWDRTRAIAGLRFRASRLFPSLHPCFPVQTPLILHLQNIKSGQVKAWQWELGDEVLKPSRRKLQVRDEAPVPPIYPEAITRDMRLF
ncbi:MAG: transglutaminase family protein [Verrucomicrobiales bacterium]